MNKRILIVDDEQEILNVWKERLEASDYDVLIANGGKEGLKVIRQEDPDLILMDVMMPDMGGGEVIKILQKDNKEIKPPIIFFTAFTSRKDYENQKTVQVNGEWYPAVPKTIDAKTLLNEITSYFS